MKITWRSKARPIIIEVIKRNEFDDIKLLRKKLRAAYPFCERRYWPYKVWCDEIRVQLGLKIPKKDKRLHRNQLVLF